MINYKLNEDELQSDLSNPQQLLLIFQSIFYTSYINTQTKTQRGENTLNMLAVQKIMKDSLNRNNNNHQQVMYSHNNHQFTNSNLYAM